MLSQRAIINGFLFDDKKSPSNCQAKVFLNAPGAVMQLFTPGGMATIGPFAGRAFTQDGFNLGATIASSSSVCGKTCEINPACAVAVFAAGQCVISGMKVTKSGVSVSFFTGQECGGAAGEANANPFVATPKVTSLESMRTTEDKGAKTGVEAVDMMAVDVGNATSIAGKEATATVTANAPVVIGAKAASESNANQEWISGIPKMALIAGALAALAAMLVGAILLYLHRRRLKLEPFDLSSESEDNRQLATKDPRNKSMFARVFNKKSSALKVPASNLMRSASRENLKVVSRPWPAWPEQSLFVRDASLPTRAARLEGTGRGRDIMRPATPGRSKPNLRIITSRD
ncbi:hypothetical protein BC830DRAFT_829862 [Chytriomyces sp. MP71]|nr:hypothetical protein BC830DRAFT_829862 [Chytriomyces sp. MP71]